MARGLYDSSFVEFNEEFFYKESLEKEGLGYSGAAHMIVAAFQTGPLKLEHLAMKAVLRHQIPLDDVPAEVRVKAVLDLENYVFLNLGRFAHIYIEFYSFGNFS